jgi:Flp pilus assembly protein CpaB
VRPAPARFPILRPPPLRVIVAVVLAVACGLIVLRTTGRAEAAVDRYGRQATAWVVRSTLEPGDVIGAGDVVSEARPASFLPAGAVTEDPTGRRVADVVVPGEVVVEHRLAGGDRRGAAALVPEGWRAVAVPALEAVLPVEVGQRVDVLAAFDPSGSGAVGATIAEDGVVVHVADDDTVTVAVTPSQASRVVAALAGGLVALALVG